MATAARSIPHAMVRRERERERERSEGKERGSERGVMERETEKKREGWGGREREGGGGWRVGGIESGWWEEREIETEIDR